MNWSYEYPLLCDMLLLREADDLCLRSKEEGDSAEFINIDHVKLLAFPLVISSHCQLPEKENKSWSSDSDRDLTGR